MPEENKNAKMSEAESTVHETKKLSEDARGLGPMQAGPFAIGRVDEIVGEGGVEVPGCVAANMNGSRSSSTGRRRSSIRIFLLPLRVHGIVGAPANAPTAA
ncbi:MAG: hypothetical protein WBV69_05035 [Candidatus Sulfotelmatobacter sp.]